MAVNNPSVPAAISTAASEPIQSRFYRTDSRISGVRTQLPQSVRVEHVSHDDFTGVATLTFDDDRRDYVLKKVETVPGIREEAEYGFSTIDPHQNNTKGALVAFPPKEWSTWDGKRRVWVKREEKSVKVRKSGRRGENRQASQEDDKDVWAAMGGSLEEGRVGCRPFVWQWKKPEGDNGGESYEGVRRGEVISHSFSGSEYGGVGSWTVQFDPAEGSDETDTLTINTVELRAALDLRHLLDCRGPPAPVPGWNVCLSRTTGEYYYAKEGVGSQWHRPGLSPDLPEHQMQCKSSCGIWGHRSKNNMEDHISRMARIKRNFEFKDEKMARYRQEGAPKGLSYYAWCVEAITSSPTFAEFRRVIGEQEWDEEHCIRGLLALRRDYDHIASDSDLSESEEEEEEWETYSDDSDTQPTSGRGKRRKSKMMPLVEEAIACYVDSPGFASRVLHHDGSNRTRSGRRFGGKNHRQAKKLFAGKVEPSVEDTGKIEASVEDTGKIEASVEGTGASAGAAEDSAVEKEEEKEVATRSSNPNSSSSNKESEK